MAIKWVDDKTVEISSVEDYLKVINKLTSKNKGSKFVYRGQKNVSYPINCGAARRFINSGHKEVTKKDLLEYHNVHLLENAKKIGLNFKDGREIKDMELIADLQHHGCATMLIDFTRNPLIALFFATEQSSRNIESDSAVYVLKIDDTEKFIELQHKNICSEKCIEEIFSKGENLHFWEPTQLNKRIPAQHSIFIFGEAEIPLKDFFLKIIVRNNSIGKIQNIVDEEKIYIRSKHQNNKNRIQENLQRTHHLNNTVLFNDLPGFSYANSQYSKLETITPEFILAKAREYYQNYKYEHALEYYTKYIKHITNDPVIYFERGNTLLKLSKPEEAIGDFNIAEKLDFKNAQLFYNRSIAKKRLKINDEALDDLSKAISIEPNNSQYLFERGKIFEELNQYFNALDDFNKSITIAPTDIEKLKERGQLHLMYGKYHEAIKDFLVIIDCDSKNSSAYYHIGLAKHLLKLDEESIEYYCKSLELNPNDYLSYYGRGSSKMSMRKYEDALTDFDKALNLDQEDSYVYYNRGRLYIYLENYEKAIDDINKAIEIDQKDEYSYLIRADAYIMIDNLQKALEDVNISIELNPMFNDAYVKRSIVYSLLGFKEESFADYSRVKNLSVTDLSFTARKELEYYFDKEGVLLPDWKSNRFFVW